MKIGLGTVQFGVDYGISNPAGQTSAKEVAEILAVAERNDIRVIDTATLYGTSEDVLGKTLPVDHQFKLVTKTLRFDTARITLGDVSLLERSFENSMQKLRCESVYGLLIHSADDLLSEDGHLLLEKIVELKQRGLVEKIGVSIYTSQQIDRILDRFAIDLIQVPLSVLDQRLLLGGHLAKLKKSGIEIHARSVFLQGLMLMQPGTLPPYFDGIKAHLVRYHEMLHKNGIAPVDAAIGFVCGLNEIDYAICGINNHLQLKDICSGFAPLPQENFREFSLNQEEILNPAQWEV